MSPSQGLLLDMLHYDVLRAILLTLDMASLNKMRRVSKVVRAIVESLYEYRMLDEHANRTMYSVYSSGSASYFTIRELFLEFRHRWCRGCGEGVTGYFLCLATLRRCCRSCSLSSAAFTLAPVPYVLSEFGLSITDVKERLPMVNSRVVRGIKVMGCEMAPSVHDLVSVAEAKRLAIEIFGSEANMEEAASQLRRVSSKSEGRQSSIIRSNRCGMRTYLPPSSSLGRFRLLTKPAGIWQVFGSSDFPFWDSETQRSRLEVLETF